MPGEFVTLDIEEVSAVDYPANKRKWLIIKRAKEREVIEKMQNDVALTTAQVLAHRQAWDEWWDLRSAFMQSMESIFAYADADEQATMLMKAVDEFATAARPIMALLGMVEKSQDVFMQMQTAAAKCNKYVMQIAMEELPAMAEKKSTAEEQVALLTKQVADLTVAQTELEKRNAALEAEAKQGKMEETPEVRRKAALAKLDPEIQAFFAEQEAKDKLSQERLAKAEADTKHERDMRRKDEAIVKVRSYKALPLNPDDHASIFMKLDAGDALDEKERDALYSILKAADEMGAQSGIFKELGRDGGAGDEKSAWGKIQVLAQELVEKGEAKTTQKAVAQVVKDNKDLYKAYQDEK